MYKYTQLTLDQSACNLGSMLGTSGHAALYKKINERAGVATSYFGSNMDPQLNRYSNFMQKIIKPIERTAIQLQQARVAISRPDEFTPIRTIEELKAGPSPCMWLPILMHPRIHQMHQNEQIEGYGYEPGSIPNDDPYGRLIHNGEITLFGDTAKIDPEDPDVIVGESVFTSIDPILSYDDLDAIEITRKFLDEFMDDPETSQLDPTNPFELRG